jgi:2-amino-4-hydroxy-6-hydroxymethyldihydropteridine diphosphokinase
MATIYLALGSNVGDCRKQIEQAIGLLGSGVNNIRRAPLYRSRAVGYTDQPDFLNTALAGQTDLSPEALLKLTQTVERQVGRQKRFRWGPREIDIDIILYGDLVRTTKALTLPHPLFRERDFVLRPLCDLNPGLRDPVSGETVSQLLARIAPSDESILESVD